MGVILRVEDRANQAKNKNAEEHISSSAFYYKTLGCLMGVRHPPYTPCLSSTILTAR